MPNASPRPVRSSGTPSRIPRRGAAAVVGTAAGLALLLSFRTPDTLPLTGLGLGALGGSDATATDAPRLVGIALGPKPTPAATDQPTQQPTATAAPTTDGGSSTATPTTEPAVTPEPTPTPKPTSSTQVVDGKVVNTRYGQVQVELTIKNGTITDVQALQLPNDRQYSAEISDYVAPYLRKMVLQAQSANIDIISGATYTSTGYAKSVQSALNSAQ
jgi:uncharacterized protein with FMN-binding domain